MAVGARVVCALEELALRGLVQPTLARRFPDLRAWALTVAPDAIAGEGARIERGVHLVRTIVFAGAHVRKSVYSAVVTTKAVYPIEQQSQGEPAAKAP